MVENFFTSPLFLLTCLGTFFAYYAFNSPKVQFVILGAVSLFIYWLAAGNLLFLLLFSATITGLFSYGSAYARSDRRKLCMIVGVLLNLSLLVFFKYKHLLLPRPVFENWFGADPAWQEIYSLALPIGISFYVFHGVSLIVDSYRNPLTLEASGRHMATHWFKTLLYISFFPQIVAGPIAKGKFFYPQICLKKIRAVDWKGAIRALAQGYFLKEVIANNLNQLTSQMVSPSTWASIASSEMLLMVFGYSAQIFADFAGYSLIAIGLARLFGYELPINFRQPYFADSFANFWQRWHISLSSWLKDYLYIPLGGNRKGRLRSYTNLFIVMFLGGLWHGAAWKYAVWGTVHGIALAGERAIHHDKFELGFQRPWIIRLLNIALVFVVVSFAWLFFRLDSLQDVVNYVQHIIDWKSRPSPYHSFAMMMLWVLIGMVFFQHLLGELKDKNRLGWLVRFDGAFTGLLFAGCFIAHGKQSAFIYFQF